jgi:hypothetical protein
MKLAYISARTPFLIPRNNKPPFDLKSKEDLQYHRKATLK